MPELRTKGGGAMSGICDTCRRTTCEYRADDIAVCGLPKTDTNWERLFGTPERAARTLEEFELDQLNWCRGTEYCESCPYEFDRYGCYLPDGFELLEWLRGDA